MGGTGSQKDQAAFERLVYGSHFICSIPGNVGNFLREKTGAQGAGLRFSVFHQCIAVERGRKSEIIFNFFCFCQCAVIFSDDCYGKAGP